MTPYIALIQAFGFDFPPQGWAQCNGQLLPINQNAALFSLLGTTYGGNGTTNFALPDLRGRNTRHFGNGLGLPSLQLGERSGSESRTLLSTNMPAHTHNVAVGVNPAAGNLATPANNRLANNAFTYNDAVTPNAFLGGVTQSTVGQGTPMNIRNPYLTVNICIALQGIYPSRN